ncbi:MAG: ABC transporter ATP-binding protein [Rhodospirillales bacterium]|jgi:ATP-binding cassette subfamily B protein
MNKSAKIKSAEEILESKRGGMDYRVPTLDGDYKLGLSSLTRIAKMALGYRVQFPLAIAAVIIAAMFQLYIPRFLGEAVDHATGLLGGAQASGSAAEEALWTAAMFLIGASILRGLFTMLHNYLGESLGQQIAYQLRLAYFEKLQRLSFSYHDKVHSGDLMTRGMLDIEGVRRFIEHGILRPILLLMLVGAGGYLYMGADLVLGLLSLSFVPFALWRASVFRLKSRALWRQLQERLSLLTRVMEENLGGIRVVRAFAAQNFEIQKFDESSEKALAIAIERVGVRYANTSIMTFAYFLAMGLVLWVGGLKVMDGEVTVGELTQFLAFMTVLQMPIRQTGMVINGIARASVSGVRLFEILDIEPAVQDNSDAEELQIGEGVLRFENVSFSYTETSAETAEHYPGDATIKDINFEVKAGSTVGIVGPPGSGKSTIAHLIPRFYDVTSGKITIDGQDIRDVTLDSLRAAVGVVQQDTFLFTSEIDANVAYGEPWAERERVVSATEASQLHAYIENLPEGYDTIVGERGVSLSGGQRQRLSIARSVMLSPQFMVFDDSTAAIDAATEQRIRVALKEVTKERATIIISHRLSSLMHADEILFLDEGSIVERGNHDSLIELGGRYKALYDLQSGQVSEDVDG